MKKINKNKGFTLIEILVVIGIIAILATVVLIAINPARQFAQARDTQRVSNVNAILNAIGQYTADNKGVVPTVITTSATSIGTAAGLIDLCAVLTPTYMPAFPTDPNSTLSGASLTDCTNGGTAYDTKYKVSKDATTGRITVAATGEITIAISISR